MNALAPQSLFPATYYSSHRETLPELYARYLVPHDLVHKLMIERGKFQGTAPETQAMAQQWYPNPNIGGPMWRVQGSWMGNEPLWWGLDHYRIVYVSYDQHARIPDEVLLDPALTARARLESFPVKQIDILSFRSTHYLRVLRELDTVRRIHQHRTGDYVIVRVYDYSAMREWAQHEQLGHVTFEQVMMAPSNIVRHYCPTCGVSFVTSLYTSSQGTSLVAGLVHPTGRRSQRGGKAPLRLVSFDRPGTHTGQFLDKSVPSLAETLREEYRAAEKEIADIAVKPEPKKKRKPAASRTRTVEVNLSATVPGTSPEELWPLSRRPFVAGRLSPEAISEMVDTFRRSSLSPPPVDYQVPVPRSLTEWQQGELYGVVAREDSENEQY